MGLRAYAQDTQKARIRFRVAVKGRAYASGSARGESPLLEADKLLDEVAGIERLAA